MAADPADVAHLLRRAGFGATASELAAFAGLDLPAIVDRLLDDSTSPDDPRPAAIGDTATSGWDQWVAGVQWWVERMAATPAPLVEKMTLFWHGHFVSEIGKVEDMTAMWEQISLFRHNALGNLRTLAQATAVNPAMLRYLDNDRNTKGAPNQNFARELMELFLLGVGNYTEDDVIAAARAWTGHGLVRGTWQYHFDAARHDVGAKTFFGLTQNFDGPGIIDTIFVVKGDVVARFLAAKLWEFFAHPGPPAGVVDALATTFRTSGFELKPLLRALFLRPEFYAPAARQGLVRSPVEWVVALRKVTAIPVTDLHPEWWMDDMGQRLYDPPNVAGWKANAYWVSATAAAARAAFASYIAWKGGSAGLLSGTASSTVDVAVDDAIATFRLDRMTTRDRQVVVDWLVAQRRLQWTGWVEPGHLIVLMALCPEMQLA